MFATVPAGEMPTVALVTSTSCLMDSVMLGTCSVASSANW